MTVARNSLVSGLPVEGRRLDLVFDPVYIEIAVARVERAEVVRELSEWSPGGFEDVDGLVARLNALVTLERRA